METRALGSSGVEVSAIGLGGMPLSLARRPAEGAAIRVIHAALDAGMTLIDTADVYCLNDDDIGHNERLIARALAQWSGDASEVVVATKGGLERPGGDWVRNGRPAHLKAACDASLKALGVEAITLYQLHAPDPEVPLADSVGALKELQEAGKIRHVGLSNVSVEEIQIARGIVTVVSVQNRCNLFERTSFQDGVLRLCVDEGIAFFPHSPVGGHWGHTRMGQSSALTELATRHKATVYEIALAWLLHKAPNIIPIPGASREASARSSARAASIALSTADMERLSVSPH